MNSTPRAQWRRPSGKRDVVKIAREEDVRFVRLVFADIFGVSKNVSIPIDRIDDALEGRITFDGGSIDGFVRGEELDMVLRPDPSSFAIYPWRAAPEGREGRLICDIAMPDGSPFEGCPRSTLRRAVESAPRLAGLRIALEIEFYLFARGAGDESSTTTPDVGSYFDFSANDRGEEARNAMVAALQSMGVPVACAHHEHGAGQHELDVAHDDPMAAADHALTLRTIAKHVAADYDLDATFMPKPLEERAGSGLHADFRLADDSDEETALYVAGGLLAHAPALTAICNPTVNSYKRLVAAWDAPIYAVWSERSAN
ncbi:MAG TPA: glutamine synthetase family protein, partial [Candidatus Cybelea sp.]